MNFDVVIIGASSSGLYAAELLANAGQRVAVFDRQSEITPTRRTYIITPQLLRVLDCIPESAILHRVDVMAVATPAARVEVKLQEPDLIVERSLLTHLLAKQAQAAGAEIYAGHRFLGLLTDTGKTALRLQTPAGETITVTARAIIGADGVYSEVSKAAGLMRPPAVPIMQSEIELPPGWDPAVTQVWFDTTDTRFFYWLIPESDKRAVVGLVGDVGSEMSSLLRDFLDRHGFRPLAYQTGWVAMHQPRLRPWSQVGSIPVLLVGDAAGQVKVTTVGGTVTGLMGAQAASRALLKGTSYAHELRPLKRELDLHWLMRNLLERFDNPGYDRLMSCINPAVVDFLSSQNRDEMVGVFWQLPFLSPRLLALGARYLFRRSHKPPSLNPVSVTELE